MKTMLILYAGKCAYLKYCSELIDLLFSESSRIAYISCAQGVLKVLEAFFRNLLNSATDLREPAVASFLSRHQTIVVVASHTVGGELQKSSCRGLPKRFLLLPQQMLCASYHILKLVHQSTHWWLHLAL